MLMFVSAGIMFVIALIQLGIVVFCVNVGEETAAQIFFGGSLSSLASFVVFLLLGIGSLLL